MYSTHAAVVIVNPAGTRSGPSNSAERRRPAPTKLQEVEASPMTECPSFVSNSTVRLAKSSEGDFV